MTAERAEALRADAWMFYRPLPSAGVGPQDLFRIAGQGLTAIVVRFAVAGLLSGLVMLLPAVMLGFIADEVVPTAFPPCATPTAST